MATRKRASQLADDDDNDADGLHGIDQQLQPDDELSQVLGELDSSGTYTIKVERLRDGKRPEYVGDMSPAGFALSHLQERFGGGEYALTVLDNARRYVKRTTVAVASPLKAAVPATAEPTGLEKLATAMTAQLQQQGQLLQLLLMQGRAAPEGVTNADPQTMRRQLLEEMQLMKGILGNGGQSVTPDKVLELVMKGMEIAKETGGTGGDGWTDVAVKAIDVLGEPLAQLMSMSAAAPAAVATPGAAGPALPRVAQPRPTMNAMNPMLKQYVTFLIRKAVAGSDPALYADLILDNVPDAMVRQFMADGDPVTKLAQFDARVVEHAEWFRDLGQACMEALNADAPGSGSGPAPADGNAGGDS